MIWFPPVLYRARHLLWPTHQSTGQSENPTCRTADMLTLAFLSGQVLGTIDLMVPQLRELQSRLIISSKGGHWRGHEAVLQIVSLLFSSRASLLFARLSFSVLSPDYLSITRKQSQLPQTVFKTCCPPHRIFAPAYSSMIYPSSVQQTRKSPFDGEVSEV